MKKMMTPVFAFLLLAPLLMGASGCPNAFKEMANTTTDAALLYDAQMSIDKSDYSDAIATLAKVTTAGRKTHDARLIAATAYAGRCGLDLLSLATDVAQQLPAGTLMKVLMNIYKSKTSYADCKLAETEMLAIPSGWRSDDYAFLSFLEMAKIGTILASGTGADSPDHDGTVNGGFDACTDSAAGIPEAQVREIGTGITILITAIKNAGLDLGGDGTNPGVGSKFDSICTSLSGVGSDLCSKTDPTLFDSTEVRALRELVKTNQIGLDTCSGQAFPSATCSCP